MAQEPTLVPAVRVSGFPFMLQGWNNVFVRVDLATGSPIYWLSSYTLYGFIDIIGCSISKSKETKKWEFWRNCDDGPLYRKPGDDQISPVGDWGEFSVSEDVTIRVVELGARIVKIAVILFVLIFSLYIGRLTR